MSFQVNNLSLSLGGDKILHDISFTLERGQVTGLLGRSGCGKSTLAKAMVGIHRVDQSCLKIDGMIFQPKFGQTGHKIQYMWQDPHMALSPFLSAVRCVEEAMETQEGTTKTLRHEKAQDLLHQVGLTPSLMQKRPHALSGGQCQRIALARAIAAQPEFLILDEPFSALDLVTQKNIISLLGNLRQLYDFGLMIISHDLRTLWRLADKLILIDQGHIIEDRPTSDFLHTPRHDLTKTFASFALADA
ncbi:ABC transporter ATP-binding protein [Kiloniella sp. EL199]|uniref:ABC transporter ATP-binding protein n=1 Tax=Kiloniella sp. EL199 TaxID=2107581 RepID=UPI000EA04336|nr:ATP-binding cassette domain-containing protein [Kiloniella sp. EL199]